MKKSFLIKLKAVFLLIVFSLSTLVSFACATGLNMGYNKNHHQIQDKPSTAVQPGDNHDHSRASYNQLSAGKKINDPKDKVAHPEKKEHCSTESTPDDCCRDEAAKFEKCDKLNKQAFSYKIQIYFITLLLIPDINADVIITSLHIHDSKYLNRNHHPPISDTRIAIQSFLI